MERNGTFGQIQDQWYSLMSRDVPSLYLSAIPGFAFNMYLVLYARRITHYQCFNLVDWTFEFDRNHINLCIDCVKKC